MLICLELIKPRKFAVCRQRFFTRLKTRRLEQEMTRPDLIDERDGEGDLSNPPKPYCTATAGWWQPALFALTAFQVFIGPMDYGIYFDKVPDGMDSIVIAKILTAGVGTVAAIWAWWSLREVRLFMQSGRSIAVTAVLALSVLGGTSGVAINSIPTAVINYFLLPFVVLGISELGIFSYLRAMLLGLVVTAIAALTLFYLHPSVGVFLEPISMTQFVPRLGGMAHPNSLSQSMVIGLLITLYLHRCGRLRPRAVILTVAIFAWAIWLTKSRTAAAAGVCGIIALYADRISLRFVVATTAIGTCSLLLAATGIVALGAEDEVLGRLVSKVAKSGELSELLTVTGRTDIWLYALELTSQRPAVGYGFNSAAHLMQGFSGATHNMVLNATLAGGIFAGIIMLSLYLHLICNGLLGGWVMVRAFASYLAINGLVEDTVFGMFATPGTMLWFAVLYAGWYLGHTRGAIATLAGHRRQSSEVAVPGGASVKTRFNGMSPRSRTRSARV